MRSLLFVVASFTITILCWGVYLPVLHLGQHAMSTSGAPARLRPFVCVGLAYFAIGVVVPLILLSLYGEDGKWTTRGALFSLFAGTLGALGALGIILAFHFGGKPVYVMPLVFGGAPIVNSFITIFLTGKMKEIGPLFFTGLIMVILGAVTVLMNQPTEETTAAKPAAAAAGTDVAAQPEPRFLERLGTNLLDFTWQMLAVALVVGSWGAYGPMLHKGQAAMDNSRLRPLLCVGLAYFLIAVLVPNALLQVIPEASSYGNFWGTVWSLAAGTAGAIGALGIIMAFNFGGKPIYVMPLIFGGAPVVSTLFSSATNRTLGQLEPMFLAGLILVVAGAVMVLVFAPRSGHPPQPVHGEENKPQPLPEKPILDEPINSSKP